MEKGKRLNGKAIGVGAVVSLCAYLLMILLLAWLTVSGRISETHTAGAILLCAGSASMIGALAASRGNGGGAVQGVLSVAAFCAVLLLAGCLAEETIVWRRMAHLAAAAMGGGVLSVLLMRRGGGGRKKRHRGLRSRR